MRDTDEEHCVFASVGCGIMQRAAGMLLKQIVNVLHARDVAVTNTIDTFVKPADRRTERDAVGPNLSSALHFFERRPQRVVINLFHSDVVQLQQVDAVRLQALQRRIRRAHDRVRRKVLRNLALTASARFAVGHKIVPDFRPDHDLIALFRERLRN